MPVYLRKNASFTPSSLANPADDEADAMLMEDFIQDPDQVRDRLPQPFRMIDKLVQRVVEDSWDIIHSREDEKMRDATKLTAPQYECSIQMQDHGNASSIASTQDGKYVMIGKTDGLAVIDAHTQQTVATWQDDKLELTNLQLSSLDEDKYMVSTVDDMGVCRLFGFYEEQIFLLATVNEQEGDKKVLASKCEASPCADYIGICLENPGNQESWLEIHKTPKDVWLKEMRSASAKAQRRAVSSSPKPPTPSVQGEDGPGDNASPTEGVVADSPVPSAVDNTDDHQSVSQSVQNAVRHSRRRTRFGIKSAPANQHHHRRPLSHQLWTSRSAVKSAPANQQLPRRTTANECSPSRATNQHSPSRARSICSANRLSPNRFAGKSASANQQYSSRPVSANECSPSPSRATTNKNSRDRGAANLQSPNRTSNKSAPANHHSNRDRQHSPQANGDFSDNHSARTNQRAPFKPPSAVKSKEAVTITVSPQSSRPTANQTSCRTSRVSGRETVSSSTSAGSVVFSRESTLSPSPLRYEGCSISIPNTPPSSVALGTNTPCSQNRTPNRKVPDQASPLAVDHGKKKSRASGRAVKKEEDRPCKAPHPPQQRLRSANSTTSGGQTPKHRGSTSRNSRPQSKTAGGRLTAVSALGRSSRTWRSWRSGMSPRPEDKSSHSLKFSATSLVLRVRPQPPVTGIQYSSAQQLAKTIDSTGDVMGTGLNHLLSGQHLELRNAVFEQHHQQLIEYKPADGNNNNNKPLPQACFHFLTAGRMLPQGLDDTTLTSTGVPTTVCVWWTGQTQVTHYSLNKTAKDLEHKPDIVWPLSSDLVASAVSPCTSLLALALANNNLVVWDKYIGLPRRVVHIADIAPIVSIHFLDPFISAQCGDDYPPYRLHTQSQVMVVCQTGNVFLVGCGVNDLTPPQPIALHIEKETERPTFVQLVQGLPQLIVTCRQNGQVFLQDLKAGGHQLCQVTLPQSHDLTSPWQPTITVAGGGQMLYMKGTSNEVKQEESVAMETDEVEERDTVAVVAAPETSLFVFPLRSFPALDKYRADSEQPAVPYVLHTTVEDRAAALLKHRISQQGLRQGRLQARWSQMKDELSVIKQRREAQRDASKSAFLKELTRRLSISSDVAEQILQR